MKGSQALVLSGLTDEKILEDEATFTTGERRAATQASDTWVRLRWIDFDAHKLVMRPAIRAVEHRNG